MSTTNSLDKIPHLALTFSYNDSRRRNVRLPGSEKAKEFAPKESAYPYASSHKRCDQFDRSP